MGRKKKYNTEEERKIAQRFWNKQYYTKNKEKINTHRMKKYYDGREKMD
jgi:2-polyprenyl-3-methyl-5-hydroxy-6-metoxy-1,4-benzoquinol methylase